MTAFLIFPKALFRNYYSSINLDLSADKTAAEWYLIKYFMFCLQNKNVYEIATNYENKNIWKQKFPDNLLQNIWYFLGISLVHQKWNGSRLLSPEVERTNYLKSCRTTESAKLHARQDRRRAGVLTGLFYLFYINLVPI